MKVVASTPFGARGCAVTGRVADTEGFIEHNSPTLGHAIHISAAAVKIMGDEFGMVPKEESTSLRYDLHATRRENDELRQRLRDQEFLEEELVAARETIAEAEAHLQTFADLADRGYSAKRIKGLLDRFSKFKEDLTEGEETLAEFLNVATEIASLSKEKVTV